MEIENGNVKRIKNPATLGINNVHWKGGVADYKNHYQMKLNRLVKLEQTKGKCEICGERARKIHHRDGSKDNHVISNLVVLCNRDHGIVDAGRKNRPTTTSIYIRKYGKTLKELSEEKGCSAATMIRRLKGIYGTTKYERKYGMKIEEMAEKLGVSGTHLYDVLSGRLIPKKGGLSKGEVLKQLGIIEKAV